MLTEGDEKQLAASLEGAGWRGREINGVIMWTLRGFEGAYTLVEAVGYVCAGWSAQRLADLTKPWYLDWSAWATVLASSGGLIAAVANEMVGSRSPVVSAAGVTFATLAPFISKYINERARQAAAMDIREVPEPAKLPQPPR